MKKKILIASAALLSVCTSGLLAGSSRNYWVEGGRPVPWYNDQDWMGKLRDNARLSQLSIPGTHDSGAYRAGGIFALTQSMNFLDQLIAGIRMWDLRLEGRSSASGCDGEDTLYTYHGRVCQGDRFVDVIRAAIVFLYNHPTETVLIRVKQEGISPLTTSVNFLEAFNKVLNGTVEVRNVSGVLQDVRVADYLYKGTEHNPRLGDLRKKIFLIKNFTGDPPSSLVYSRQWCDTWSQDCPHPLAIQDEYSLNSNFDLAHKWRLVQAHLNAANNSYLTAPDTLYVNFASANALASPGSFVTGYPFFFASGQVGIGKDSPQLWTSFLTSNCPSAICLPEFPTYWGFVYYEGINQLLSIEMIKSLINRTPRNRTGIIMMDFPGGGLIADIILFNNTQHVFPGGPIANPVPASDASRWYNQPLTVDWNWYSTTPLRFCLHTTFVYMEGKRSYTATCRDSSQVQGSSTVDINIDYGAPRGIVKLSRPVIAGTPTGRPVVQTITGSFEDSLPGIDPSTVSGIDPSSGRYLIEDSYGGTSEGRVMLTRSFFRSNATFFFQVSLNTTVRPNEPRTYRIKIFAMDRAGNTGQISADAVVR